MLDTYCMESRLTQLQGVRTLEDHTYESLRRAISSGVFEPGQRLSADGLAKDLGVSRMPVVQALRRLASEGFVAAEPHKAMRVADPTPGDIRERYLVMVALERLCASEAFERDADAVVRSLRERLAEQRMEPASPTEEDECDRAFHAVLWDVSGLPSVASMLQMLWDRGGYYRALLFAHTEYREARLAEHAAVLAAAERKDVQAVVEALEEHRWRGMARMLEIVRDRQQLA
jgi:DNA-binding GntR family transcriptional regulator